jgi:hypothetical protein
MVLTGLSLAHGLLEAPLPDMVIREIGQNPQVRRIAAQRSEEVFHSPREGEPGYWGICRFNFFSFDNWRGRLRYLIRMAFSPGVQDFEAARLPRFLFPLYPCIRLFRLAWQLTLRENSAADR